MGNKFILGTANLGMKYGISNQGKLSEGDSQKIIIHALSRGIKTFDTAAQYGVAEELLGTVTCSSPGVKVITKIPSRERYTFEYVSACLESSLIKLKQEKIYGLIFHDPDIHTKDEIGDISKRLLELGKIEHLGFSGYTHDAVLTAKEKNPIWTIFEVPENILDGRLKNSKEISELAASDNLFFIRSVFLQGLLLMRTESMPTKFLEYKKIFDQLNDLAVRLDVTVLDLCLSYISKIQWSSGNIIAAASTTQLDEILDYNEIREEFDFLQKLPNQVLDPRQWDNLP